MKKKNRPQRSSKTQTRGSIGEDITLSVNRGRPRKNDSVAIGNPGKDSASKGKTESPSGIDVTQKCPDSKARSSGKYLSTS